MTLLLFNSVISHIQYSEIRQNFFNSVTNINSRQFRLKGTVILLQQNYMYSTVYTVLV